MATGCLSEANAPALPGLDDFTGQVLHTGRWPHEPVDLTGKRVGVIGTGSSGIQAIPEIAKVAASVTVFQRTPNYSIPAGNAPLTPEAQAELKADYAGIRARNLKMQSAYSGSEFRTRASIFAFDDAERDRIMWDAWKRGGPALQFMFNDVSTREDANAVFAKFIHDRIAEAVHDPDTARRLTPTNFFGVQTRVPRHELLRDVQPTARPPRRPARHAHHARDRRAASSSATRKSNSTRSCWPPGSTR